MLFIPSFLLLFNKNITGQTEKGNWLLEGSLGNITLSNFKYEESGLNTISKSDGKNYFINLYPKIGYFISKNVSLGATVNLAYQFYKQNGYYLQGQLSNLTESKSATLGLLPNLRFYLNKNIKNKFYIQVESGYTFSLFGVNNTMLYSQSASNVASTYNSHFKSHSFIADAQFGYNHFITEKVALDMAVGYGYQKQTQISEVITPINSYATNNVTTFTIKNRSVLWSLGFSFFIVKKQKEKQ